MENTDPTELLKVHADQISQKLNVLALTKYTRAENIIKLIKESQKLP